MKQELKFLYLTFLLLGITLFITGIFRDSSGILYIQEYKAALPENFNSNDSSFTLQEIYSSKLEYYQSDLNNLKNIQLGMLIIITISLMTVVYKSEKMVLPFISIQVPSGLVYTAIYFGGLYLWANFGLTFNSLINGRLSLHAILDQLEQYQDTTIDYRHSLQHILADSSLLDNYFSHYFKIFDEATDNEWVENIFWFFGVLGLFIIYGGFFGLFIACMIIATWEYINLQKFENKILDYLIIIFPALLLIASVISFISKNLYSINWIGCILFWCGIFILLWSINRKVIIKNSL